MSVIKCAHLALLMVFAHGVCSISSGSRVITIGSTGNFPLNFPLVPMGPISVSSLNVGPRKLPDGTVVRDCFDARNGVRAHKEEWIRSNAWKIVCENGTSKVIGCVGTQRTNFAPMAIGESKDVNGFWHKCEKTDDGQIKYSQEASCVAIGKELHINDTFRNGAFKMKCETWGYSIAGCYYYNDKGEVQELGLNKTADVGIMRHNCEPVPGVKGRVKYHVHATACKKDDVVHQINETWVSGSLKYKCLQNGAFIAIGCVTPSGKELAVGEDYVHNNTVHRCYRRGRTTYYHAYACGFAGVSCDPKPLTPVAGSVSGLTFVGAQPSGGAVVRTTPAETGGTTIVGGGPFRIVFRTAALLNNQRITRESFRFCC